MLVLDIDYHYYTWTHARGDVDWARFWVAVQAWAQLGLGLGLGFLGEQGSTRTAISGGTATYVRIWISIIITTYGLMRADTSIGRDSGLRRRRGHS